MTNLGFSSLFSRLISWAQNKTADYFNARALKRAQKTPRDWRAISPHGQVQLGRINYAEALSRASQLGIVSYTDFEHAIIFYGTQRGAIDDAG